VDMVVVVLAEGQAGNKLSNIKATCNTNKNQIQTPMHLVFYHQLKLKAVLLQIIKIGNKYMQLIKEKPLTTTINHHYHHRVSAADLVLLLLLNCYLFKFLKTTQNMKSLLLFLKFTTCN